MRHKLPTVSEIVRAMYPRTVCACALCKAPCRAKPGFLLPGDMDLILEKMHKTREEAMPWILEHFVSSEGALVQQGTRQFRIPSIVPAQKENGECVFFGEDGRCGIHRVSPAGCAIFDMHGFYEIQCRVCLNHLYAAEYSPPEEIPDYLEYRQLRLELEAAGKIAKPIADRQHVLALLLEQIEQQRERNRHAGV